MAESVCENVDVIERSLHELRTAEVVANLRDLADSMNSLNKKNQIAPQPDDISNFMKYVLDDENGNKEAFFDQLEILGNAMYFTAIQFKMSVTISHNLDWYANMLNTCDGTDAELKSNPCIKKMRQFLINQWVDVIHTPARSRSHCINLLRELEDVNKIAETPTTSPVSSQSSNDDDPSSNRSSGHDSQGVPYNDQSQQPSTSKPDEEETQKSRKQKGKSPLNELVDVQKEVDDATPKKET